MGQKTFSTLVQGSWIESCETFSIMLSVKVFGNSLVSSEVKPFPTSVKGWTWGFIVSNKPYSCID